MNDLKIVCLYGPESTGKTTCAIQLAEFYQTEYVPEVAREFIQSNKFSIEDIIKIGEEQAKRIQEKTATANRVLICDTDLITTQIYSNHYLGMVPPVLFGLEKEIRFDHYFLFDIDVPWVHDGLRDLKHKREEMLGTFRLALEVRGLPYTWVRGNYDDRISLIKKKIDEL
jgi:HTH-type transcriptional regulator, transcriptional repressor of NAD biosynthesis genes